MKRDLETGINSEVEHEPYLQGIAKMEANIQTECEKLKRKWQIGFYNFLHSRTLNEFTRASTKKRRSQVSAIGVECPPIDDVVLEALFFRANGISIEKQKHFGDNSGYNQTPAEKDFIRNLLVVLKDPKFKDVIVLPDSKTKKWAIGCHLPDILFLGFKQRGFSAIAFEIMGEVHEIKSCKDEVIQDHLQELGIVMYPLQNHVASKFYEVEKIINGLELGNHNKKLKIQTQRVKRRIWAKTITTHLTLAEIEEFVQQKFDLQLNLKAELTELLNFKACPRKIKAEYRNNRSQLPKIQKTT